MATAPLISIKNVTATQIPPNNLPPILLKEGTLTLTEPLAGTDTDAKLFLTLTPDPPASAFTVDDETSSSLPDSAELAPLTIPLHPSNFIGSRSGLCTVFRFKIPSSSTALADSAGTSSEKESEVVKDKEDLGSIDIAFPGDISDEDATSFEKVLVYNGFLKTGFVAEADEYDVLSELLEFVKKKVGVQTE